MPLTTSVEITASKSRSLKLGPMRCRNSSRRRGSAMNSPAAAVPAHTDARYDHLRLASLFVVHSGDDGVVAGNRSPLELQIQRPVLESRTAGVGDPISVLIAAGKVEAQWRQRTHGPLIIQPPDQYRRTLPQIFKTRGIVQPRVVIVLMHCQNVHHVQCGQHVRIHDVLAKRLVIQEGRCAGVHARVCGWTATLAAKSARRSVPASAQHPSAGRTGWGAPMS